MSDMTKVTEPSEESLERADGYVASLLTNGLGDTGHRLMIVGDGKTDLGGWGPTVLRGKIAEWLDEAEQRGRDEMLEWAKECVAAANIVQPDEGVPLSESNDLHYIIEFLADRYESLRDSAEQRGAERVRQGARRSDGDHPNHTCPR